MHETRAAALVHPSVKQCTHSCRADRSGSYVRVKRRCAQRVARARTRMTTLMPRANGCEQRMFWGTATGLRLQLGIVAPRAWDSVDVWAMSGLRSRCALSLSSGYVATTSSLSMSPELGSLTNTGTLRPSDTQPIARRFRIRQDLRQRLRADPIIPTDLTLRDNPQQEPCAGSPSTSPCRYAPLLPPARTTRRQACEPSPTGPGMFRCSRIRPAFTSSVTRLISAKAASSGWVAGLEAASPTSPMRSDGVTER
jgi:hypothetical protein